MTNQSKLDHRIATAEGSYQAERYRRERVEQKLDRRNAHIRELEHDIEVLRACIENAPHGPQCTSWRETLLGAVHEPTWTCTCWKKEAL